MRKPSVVDTNVLWVANGGADYSRRCALACAAKLIDIQKSGSVVLDHGREILNEYAKQPQVGQPGIGLQFLKWIYNTKLTKDHCEWVTITRDDLRGYAQFPDHPGLASFDRSDRKFVAVSIAHGNFPPIIQAVDSKWLMWSSALLQCGVVVEFLCPAEIEEIYRKKMGA